MHVHILPDVLKRGFRRLNSIAAESGVLLPDGSHVAYLGNSVRIVYQEKGYAFTIDLPFL